MEHDLDPDRYQGMTLTEVRYSQERVAIESAFRRNNYRLTMAAKELGITRSHLYVVLERLEMERPRRPARYRPAVSLSA